MCYTYNEVKNWTVDTYNDVKETVKDAIAWVDTNVINPTGKALANAGRQIKNGFTTVANAIADNVGAKVSTSKEKTLNTDYYFFATVENGIGYSKDFGGEKPVNFFCFCWRKMVGILGMARWRRCKHKWLTIIWEMAMVLGYHDGEICGYIYREIYISVFLGILVGYPTGIGFATLVFKTIGFGTVGNVSWFMWLLVPVVVFVFTLLVTLILRPKIVKTRMNESLKAVE